MILISFVRKYIAPFIIAITCEHTFASTIHEITNFQNSDAQIETTCPDEDSPSKGCSVVLVKNKSRKKLLHNTFAPAYIGITDGVFTIKFPCGTECSATYFFSEKYGLSGPYPLVIAKNLKSNLVLFILNNSLYTEQIFRKKLGKTMKFKRIHLPIKTKIDIMQSVIGAKPHEDGFIIHYTDENGNEKFFTWKK